ncbi:hypothetical protein KL916_005439 [Ogataea parapolymorpha]|nr:hypothetical protein KL916_005439 [Ogataea parapolymorpha]
MDKGLWNGEQNVSIYFNGIKTQQKPGLNRNHFTDFRPTNGYISGIASGVQVNGKGTVVLSKRHKTVTLKDVLYAPQCPSNLIAINKAVLAGKEIKISNKKLWCGKDLLGTYHHQNKLFKSTYKVMSSSSYSKAYKASVSDLHIVMGHPPKSISARLQIPNPPHPCQDFVAGRFVKSKPKISSTSVSRPLELLHADICGPFPHTGINGEKYFLVIVDRFTHITSSYCLKVKSEATDLIQQFITNLRHNCHSIITKLLPCVLIMVANLLTSLLKLFLHPKASRKN